MNNKIVFTALLALAIAISAPAGAVPIIVGGLEYDVSWSIGEFEEIDAINGLRDQPWWDNPSLAFNFASALGYVDDGDNANAGPSLGPIFAHAPAGSGGAGCCASSLEGGPTLNLDVSFGVEYAYAFTRPIASVPEPSSAGLIALGIAWLAFTGKKRRKLRAETVKNIMKSTSLMVA